MCVNIFRNYCLFLEASDDLFLELGQLSPFLHNSMSDEAPPKPVEASVTDRLILLPPHRLLSNVLIKRHSMKRAGRELGSRGALVTDGAVSGTGDIASVATAGMVELFS
jgi:hypothetical protein